MRSTNQKALDYLQNNPIVANFIEKVNKERETYYANMQSMKGKTDLTV